MHAPEWFHYMNQNAGRAMTGNWLWKCMLDLYYNSIDASGVSVSYLFNWNEINDGV